MTFIDPVLTARLGGRPVPVSRRVHAVLDGRDVAEALTTRQRELVIAVLHGYGWDDTTIGEHTRTTPYTIARIRVRLGLPDHNAARATVGTGYTARGIA